jgi:hypothetical protein
LARRDSQRAGDELKCTEGAASPAGCEPGPIGDKNAVFEPGTL